MSLFRLAQILQHSSVGNAIQNGIWLYPLFIVAHVLALMVAFGSILFWDLRLLGIGLKCTPVSAVARLLPWTWGGFSVMFVTGSLLISSEAERLYANTAFRVKIVGLMLLGLNMLLFHATVFRTVVDWDQAAVPPLRARMAGAVSMFLWLGILVSGRMIGYTLGN